MELIIVTGLSGAGKTRTINALEDIGYYCIDNMPPSLLAQFAELCMHATTPKPQVAVVTDVRGGELFHGFFEGLDALPLHGVSYKILFLESSDEVLIRRFRETRRKHPLLDECEGSVAASVTRERELLKSVRARADFIIDTSQTSPAELKERIQKLFLGDAKAGLLIQCLSFGFKFGAPTEADLMFDVRCLPNPYYIDALRPMTGLDKPIRDWLAEKPQTNGFLARFFDLIDYLMPLYQSEGKSQLVIATGCTGGKHRSVYITDLLYSHLCAGGLRVSVNHRDISKH